MAESHARIACHSRRSLPTKGGCRRTRRLDLLCMASPSASPESGFPSRGPPRHTHQRLRQLERGSLRCLPARPPQCVSRDASLAVRGVAVPSNVGLPRVEAPRDRGRPGCFISHCRPKSSSRSRLMRTAFPPRSYTPKHNIFSPQLIRAQPASHASHLYTFIRPPKTPPAIGHHPRPHPILAIGRSDPLPATLPHGVVPSVPKVVPIVPHTGPAMPRWRNCAIWSPKRCS